MIFLIYATGCKKDVGPKAMPFDDDLVHLLADLHILEASMAVVPTVNRDSVRDQARLEIAEIHGMSLEEMKNMVASLERDLPRHRMLYDRVITTLQEWQNAADSLSIPFQEKQRKNKLSRDSSKLIK